MLHLESNIHSRRTSQGFSRRAIKQQQNPTHNVPHQKSGHNHPPTPTLSQTQASKMHFPSCGLHRSHRPLIVPHSAGESGPIEFRFAVRGCRHDERLGGLRNVDITVSVAIDKVDPASQIPLSISQAYKLARGLDPLRSMTSCSPENLTENKLLPLGPSSGTSHAHDDRRPLGHTLAFLSLTAGLGK
jgi:hypothetical protein